MAQPSPEITGYDVAGRWDVSYRTLMRWVEAGLLRPPGYICGQRAPVTWTPSLMREAGILAALRRVGFDSPEMARCANHLRRQGRDAVAGSEYIAILRGGREKPAFRLCDSETALNLVQQRPSDLAALVPIDS